MFSIKYFIQWILYKNTHEETNIGHNINQINDQLDLNNQLQLPVFFLQVNKIIQLVAQFL